MTESPADFRDGAVWSVILDIHAALQAIGYALLVLFFVVGVVKTCGSFAELKRPELAVKLFIRFACAKGLITYGLELMTGLLSIMQGTVSSIMNAAGFGGTEDLRLPDEIVTAIRESSFIMGILLGAVSVLACALIWALAFSVILTVYGRFFKLYIYTAVAPLPLAAFAGEPTRNIGKSFLRSYAAVCLEGAVIVLACVIYSAMAQAPPEVDESAEAVAMIWQYIGQLCFNMLILSGTVRISDRLVREAFGM